MVAETHLYWLLEKFLARWRHFFGYGVRPSWAFIFSIFSKTTAQICANFFQV